MHRKTHICALALITAVVAVGCDNTFHVGATAFFVEHGAEPPADLPEAMEAMQDRIPEVPDGMWDVTVLLFPAWQPVGARGTMCDYHHDLGQIHVRTVGETTVDTCIPHEFAHRWRFIEARAWWAIDPETYHDERFAERFARLKDAAKYTWAHPKSNTGQKESCTSSAPTTTSSTTCYRTLTQTHENTSTDL